MSSEVRFNGKTANLRRVAHVYIAPESARPADDRIFSPLQEERAMRLGVDARKSERRNLHIAFMSSGSAQLFSNELRQAVGVLRPAWVDFIDRQIIRGALPDWIVESIDRQAR